MNRLKATSDPISIEGFEAHAAGVPFGPSPYPEASIEALKWRFGWNDRALGSEAALLHDYIIEREAEDAKEKAYLAGAIF